MEKKTKHKDYTFFERVERLHPYKMIMILSLIGSSLIFFFLLFSFFTSINQEGATSIEVPAVFVLSTLLILASSFILQPVQKYFQKEETKSLLLSLRFTFILGSGFGICQVLGWAALSSNEIFFSSSVSSSFFYVLTGLHGLHFIAAHTYLGVLIFQTRAISQDPVKYLIAETNPIWPLKFELLTMSWHFLDILWIVLISSLWIFL